MSNNFLLNLAIGQTAKLVAKYLDEKSISPADLEQAAAANRPLLTEVVSAIPESSLALVRSSFGSIAGDLCRDHPGQGHPYMWVLQQNCLSVGHAAHVQVILRHRGWYRQQMDSVVSLLFGSAN